MKEGLLKDMIDAIRDWVKGKLADITALFPTQASSSNQLADKAFVNSSVQTATANFRGSWSTWANVPSDASLYPLDFDGNRVPGKNDYMILEDASGFPLVSDSINIELAREGNYNKIVVTFKNISYSGYFYENSLSIDNGKISVTFASYPNNRNIWVTSNSYRLVYDGKTYEIGEEVKTNLNSTQSPAGSKIIINTVLAESLSGTWRFKYTGNWSNLLKNGWVNEYKINEEPLTAAQVAAINSGITAELVQKLIAL